MRNTKSKITLVLLVLFFCVGVSVTFYSIGKKIAKVPEETVMKIYRIGYFEGNNATVNSKSNEELMNRFKLDSIKFEKEVFDK